MNSSWKLCLLESKPKKFTWLLYLQQNRQKKLYIYNKLSWKEVKRENKGKVITMVIWKVLNEKLKVSTDWVQYIDRKHLKWLQLNLNESLLLRVKTFLKKCLRFNGVKTFSTWVWLSKKTGRHLFHNRPNNYDTCVNVRK